MKTIAAVTTVPRSRPETNEYSKNPKAMTASDNNPVIRSDSLQKIPQSSLRTSIFRCKQLYSLHPPPGHSLLHCLPAYSIAPRLRNAGASQDRLMDGDIIDSNRVLVEMLNLQFNAASIIGNWIGASGLQFRLTYQGIQDD